MKRRRSSPSGFEKEAGDDRARQMKLAFARDKPRADEVGDCTGGSDAIAPEARHGASPELAMKYFCLMMLNLNEFVYLD